MCLAVALADVFLVAVLVNGQDNDKVESTCALGQGAILGGDRNVEGRGVWVGAVKVERTKGRDPRIYCPPVS